MVRMMDMIILMTITKHSKIQTNIGEMTITMEMSTLTTIMEMIHKPMLMIRILEVRYTEMMTLVFKIPKVRLNRMIIGHRQRVQ